MKPEKANFDDVYNCQDPRPYYRAVSQLDYAIPHHAQSIIQTSLDSIRAVRDRPVVLDLCSGYGLNGALIRHAITLQQLYEHYCSSQSMGLPRNDLARQDSEFFGRTKKSNSDVIVVGLDTAPNAIEYANNANLTDYGIVCNLEDTDPDEHDKQTISSADLITITGGLSYITSRTFRRIFTFSVSGKSPIILWFALCATDTNTLVATLEDHGYSTIESNTPYPQRRITQSEPSNNHKPLTCNQKHALNPLYHYATLYLSWDKSRCLINPAEWITNGEFRLRAPTQTTRKLLHV